ncbi:MAG: hypothetical protein JXR23_08485 [Pontiellaceae bacterium]|nr:hypothetical protein [Pontiellaceae bacterium]
MSDRVHIVTALFAAFVAAGVCAQERSAEVVKEQKPVLTHKYAAVVFAKRAGIFDEYVDSDATLSDCVSFMNEQGILFSLSDVVSQKKFTSKDCARVMGQMSLIFLGEAKREFGSVGMIMLPDNIDSWEQYCIINGVEYKEMYKKLEAAVAGSS